MRVPLSLLLGFCDPGLSPEEISSVLALSGTEVERVTTLGVADSTGFVVGHVLVAEPHPDADRLRVCSVDVGQAEPTAIVCGAPNVALGQTVAVALPGAVMPNGMKIKSAKLRGVKSEGMICSEEELGLGQGAAGIMVLEDETLVPGTPLGEVLPLGEIVLELEITPNRPDCLGVYGLARELHAATGAPLAPEPWASDLGSAGQLDGIAVDVESAEICPRFTARIYDGVTAAQTPADIRAHLTAAGIRPISPVVDITNYTMLVVGEPLHAFDLDQIEGAQLTVRAATNGETVATLDGVTRTLNAGEPVICDSTGPTSIAGVMGGARSEVSETTTRVLLEAAVWNGPTINRTSGRLALRSEASGRFEKGLAAVQADRGQAFASQLFERIFGVAPRSGTVAVGDLPSAVEVDLSIDKLSSIMGSPFSAEKAGLPLERLGFTISETGGMLSVTVPPDRLDVTRDVDLIEEIARIDGLHAVPATLPGGGSGGGRLTRSQRIRRQVADSLVGAGMWEIAGWNFSSPSLWDKLRLPGDDPRRIAVTLRNPMSVEESVMRTTLLGSLLDAAGSNASRGVGSIRLFETGPVFLQSEGPLAREPQHVAGLLAGSGQPADWRNANPAEVDVHAGVGVLGSVLDSLHCNWELIGSDEPEPFLHPGRSGTVLVDGSPAGWAGELHPLVAKEWGLEEAVVFELSLESIVVSTPETIHFHPYSQQPAVEQDLAVVIPADVTSASVAAIARGAGAANLEAVEIFDRYEGTIIGEGMVSLGLRLKFRANDRTLTEEEVSASRLEILNALEAQIGAQARA